MKLLSWNVNGIRAVREKGFFDFFQAEDPDILCLQETRVEQAKLDPALQNVPGYHSYWHEAEKKGYSGVGIYSKTEPLAVRVGLGDPRFDSEGRVLTLEYADFHLVNAYFPNSQHGLVRLDYKLAFNTAFLAYCETLRQTKPVVFCGDLNVAHEEIDLANPKQNTMNPGFCIEERNWFSGMLACGYADTFRLFSKEGGQYSWWSYRFKAREKNIGWRIDYFVVSRELLPRVTRAWILDQVYGSDHCPVALELS